MQVTSNPIPTADPRVVTKINLDRALNRLETKVLSSPEAHSRLQHSHYERVRTFANLEHARTLLLRIEHDSSSLKIQSQKAAAQTSLSAQRAMIKRLSDRLSELERNGDDSADWQERTAERGEEDDILALDVGQKPDPTTKSKKETEADTTDLAHSGSHRRHPSEPQNVIRNRNLHPKSQSLKPGDMTSLNAHTTGASTSQQQQTPPSITTAQILESSSSTQEALTSSLVSMATQLKKSSQAFSASLVEDTAHLDRAVEGLDRNTSGMDAAGSKMGLFKRMSEGQGWWGRMMLYAWIAGLWVVAILLVGVGPKLRF